VLREPAPPRELPITTAMWRFNRAVAYAAKGQVAEAEREQAEFRKAVQAVPEDAMMAVNPAHKVLSIADHMLAGEIAFRRGEIDASVAELRKAIAIEDDLLYMEPPEWIQPVRHTLGAVLVSAGRFDEAERVYREDLEIWPENGWSLHGLARCLEARGQAVDAAQVQERFAKAWQRADVKIDSSCLCVPGGQRRADATLPKR
jgi:tetratricopeptide (TPR) repeat protein